MTRRRLSFGLLCGVLGAGSGCSLLVSTDELSGGEASAASEVDASTDAPRPAAEWDATTAPDGSDAEAGPPPPFCASQDPRPTFCNDFDVLKAPADGWTFVSTYGPDVIVEHDRTLFVSSPASVRLGTGAGVPGTQDGYVSRLAYRAPAAGTSIRVELKLRIEAIDPNHQPHLLWLSWGPDAFIMLRASQTAASLQQQLRRSGGELETYQTPLAKLVPLETWVRFELLVGFNPTGEGTVQVNMNGQPAIPTTALDPQFASTDIPQLSIGPASYTSATIEPSDVRYDDVLFDVR
jgi:hypothetical protein